MPPNSIAKTSLIVGGLTFLGFLAGGRLGSMFGKIHSFYTYILIYYISIQKIIKLGQYFVCILIYNYMDIIFEL